MRRLFALTLLSVLFLALPARALITRLTSLQDLLDESTFVVTAKVDVLDEKRPSMILALDETLKGKAGFTRMPVLLQGDARAKKFKETPDLLKRLAVKLPLVLFVKKTDDTYAAFAFSNGTWFSLTGVTVDGEVRWSFTHLETFLRRTFKGTTGELDKLLRAAIAGKGKLPPADSKEKPGIGPEVKTGARLFEEPLPEQTPSFAVVPTVLVGGPLALLAMLFPTVFGDWKRWLVLLSTVGTNSTLYTLQWWYQEALVGSWWGSREALWIGMSVVNLLGLCWAWQRHARRVLSGQAPLLAGKFELLLLSIVGVLGLGLVAACMLFGQPLLDPLWLPVWTYVGAFWGGVVYILWTWIRGARLVPACSTEAVVLSTLAVAGLLLLPALPGRAALGGVERTSGESGEGEKSKRIDGEPVWTFRLPQRGSISSSPLVVGDRVWIAAAFDDVFASRGALICLDRASGKPIWTFDNGKKMKQIYSTPTLVDGRLYIGEGFHQDDFCKVYCIEAATGKLVWATETDSHTESTPVVVDGKVYIGAGDDGFYCLEAATGKKLWNLPQFHFDSSAAVHGRRLFVGAGTGDAFKAPAMFCVDADTGKPIWRVMTDYPVWSRPVVANGFVYLATGNGRANEADPRPAGQVLCVREKDGSEVWKVRMADGILVRPVADRQRLWIGCRDGFLSCLRRENGLTIWRRQLGSPVVASPVLDSGPTGTALASRVYAISIDGQFVCLDATSGEVVWGKDLAALTKTQVEVLSTPAVEQTLDDAGKEVCRVYLGITLMSSSRLGELHCYEERAR